jgi:asparagine synthase (glutamine-hydrolysing)
MCELAGVDVAFPMLEEGVVAFSATLPPDLKLRRTTLRYFFKEALKGFLPPEVLGKEKHGFGLPVGPWLLNHQPLQDLARSSVDEVARRGIVQRTFLDYLCDDALRQHPAYYGALIWVLMMLGIWLQKLPR